MMTIRFIYFLLIGIFLMSCKPVVLDKPIETTTTPQSRSTIKMPTGSPKKDATLITSIINSTPSMLITNTPVTVNRMNGESIYIQNIPLCENNVIPLPLEDKGSSVGTFIFQTSGNGQFIKFDSISGKLSEIALPDKNRYESLGISPDGNWMAFSKEYDFRRGELIAKVPVTLISTEGKILQTSVDITEVNNQARNQFDDSYVYVGWRSKGWLNSELISMVIWYSDDPESGSVGPGNSFFGYVNPFTGVWWQEKYAKLPDWIPYSRTNLSPDLSRTLLSTTKGLVLWDLNQQKQIWEGYGDEFTFWTGNSQYVVISTLLQPFGESSINILDRNGIIKRQVQKIFTEEEKQIRFVNYRWSKDNNRLAIIGKGLRDDPSNDEPTLFIYDIDQATFTYRCPMVGIEHTPDLLWSPKGTFIATTFPGFSTSPSLIFDLESGKTYRMKDNGIIMGWIAD